MVDDLQNRKPVEEISTKFHATLIDLFSAVCTTVQKEYDLSRVVLSGGCFQNAILLRGLIQALQKRKFEVFAHQMVPTNDGGISLGQAVIAANQMT